MLFSEFLYILIFPGLLFTLYMSIVLGWLFRKLMARMENRRGPPFNQPAYDIAKLMAKERVYPEGSEIWVNKLIPRLQLSIAMFMTLFIPITGNQGLLSFEGDIFLFLFLLALHGSSTFFVGWASNNPYCVNGAGRAVLTEISLEIPMSLSIAGMAIMTGSSSIAGISSRINPGFFFESPWTWLYILPLLLLLGVMIYATLGALEYNPFSAAHAETEIVSGWNTELTGSDLAYTKLAELLNLFNLTGLITAIFLGGPIDLSTSSLNKILIIVFATISALIKIVFVLFILVFIATTSSRLRIDQITRVLWLYFLPTSMIAILLILLIKGGGLST